jgi:tetratricopeptide (TPR) repeat protein
MTDDVYYYGNEPSRLGEVVIDTYDDEAGQITVANAYGLVVESVFGRVAGGRVRFRESTHDERERFQKEQQVGSREFHLRTGRTHGRSQDYRAAAQSYATAVSLKEDDYESLLFAGEYYVMAKEFGTAIDHLARFLKQRPDNFEARLFLAVALRQKGRSTEADSLLEPLRAATDAEFQRLMREWGVAEIGELIQMPYVCVPICEERVRRLPLDAEAWYDLASAYEDSGQSEKSEEAYAHYVRIKPAEQSPMPTAEESLGQDRDIIS